MNREYTYICYNTTISQFKNYNITIGKEYVSHSDPSKIFISIIDDRMRMIHISRKKFLHTIEEHRKLILDTLFND